MKREQPVAAVSTSTRIARIERRDSKGSPFQPWRTGSTTLMWQLRNHCPKRSSATYDRRSRGILNPIHVRSTVRDAASTGSVARDRGILEAKSWPTSPEGSGFWFSTWSPRLIKLDIISPDRYPIARRSRRVSPIWLAIFVGSAEVLEAEDAFIRVYLLETKR